MISKICSGHSFSGSLLYICQKSKRPDIVSSEGVRVYDLKLMIKDFQAQYALRPEKKQACFHGILSFYPGEKPSDTLIPEIAGKYLSGLGIRNTQYAVVKHTDKAHLHVHIVANLVDNDGKSITDKWIGLRGKKQAQHLTLAYNLQQGLSKNLLKTNVKSLRTPEQHQYKIYSAIKLALPKSKSIADLQKLLEKSNIQMEFKHKGKSDEIQGVSFRLGAYCFKGSQIDRMFSYGNLVRQLTVNLKQDLTMPSLKKKLDIVESRKVSSVNPHVFDRDSNEQALAAMLHALLRPEQTQERLPPELRGMLKKKIVRRPKL